MLNNVLTASRMNGLTFCPRSHFWAFEVGLVKDAVGTALTFGSAWHRGMDARWRGADYDAALLAAIPEGIRLGAYDCATVAALLAAYYDYWGPIETFGKILPEQEFNRKILGGGYSVAGKIDGLGELKNGRHTLIESKTTSASIADDSDYWLRLKFNLQVLNYVAEARLEGWEIASAYYDVTRKPAIRPKAVKGMKRKETPDEFSDRLWQDALNRPEFYFARREIPILDEELSAFEYQRAEFAMLIEHYRSREVLAEIDRDPRAWPRNVSKNCVYCAYKSFCLQNISVDLQRPPTGFSIKPFNPELTHDTAEETTETDE